MCPAPALTRTARRLGGGARRERIAHDLISPLPLSFSSRPRLLPQLGGLLGAGPSAWSGSLVTDGLHAEEQSLEDDRIDEVRFHGQGAVREDDAAVGVGFLLFVRERLDPCRPWPSTAPRRPGNGRRPSRPAPAGGSSRKPPSPRRNAGACPRAAGGSPGRDGRTLASFAGCAGTSPGRPPPSALRPARGSRAGRSSRPRHVSRFLSLRTPIP